MRSRHIVPLWLVIALLDVWTPHWGDTQTRAEMSDLSRLRLGEKDYAYVYRAGIWAFPRGSEKVIFVCWENPSDRDTEAREWVQEAIANTWQKHSALTFRGWKKCANRNAGIRILIDDVGPHVQALGARLDALPNGMVLNFAFTKWEPSCLQTLEPCIRRIAVHEFGHAIGFGHEQNRPDAPGECRQLQQGPSGVGFVPMTPYDPESAMNYCNKNDDRLSALDVKALQELYCRRDNPVCTPQFY